MALGAAVIGRMERLPTIACSAIGLGIVSQAARFHYSSDAYRSADHRRDHRAGAACPGGPPACPRLTSAAISTWQETREVRPIPAELRGETAVRVARWILGALLVALLVRDPHRVARQPDRAGHRHRRLRADRALARRAHRLGRTGEPRADGVRRASAPRWPAPWRRAGTWTSSLILLASGALGATLAVIVGVPTLRARGPGVRGDHARVRARDLRLLAEHRVLADAPLAAPRRHQPHATSSGSSRSGPTPSSTCSRSSSWRLAMAGVRGLRSDPNRARAHRRP